MEFSVRVRVEVLKHSFCTKRQFHDDDDIAGIYLLGQLLGRNDSGHYQQPFFLLGQMNACHGACGNKRRNTCDSFHWQTLVLEKLVQVLYGSVKAGIALSGYGYLLVLVATVFYLVCQVVEKVDYGLLRFTIVDT